MANIQKRGDTERERERKKGKERNPPRIMLVDDVDVKVERSKRRRKKDRPMERIIFSVSYWLWSVR